MHLHGFDDFTGDLDDTADDCEFIPLIFEIPHRTDSFECSQ